MTTLRSLAEETLRLAGEATPGPWTTEQAPRFHGAVSARIDGHSRQVACANGEAVQHDRPDVDIVKRLRSNAEHIAHARTAAPALATALLKVLEAAPSLRVARLYVPHSDDPSTGAFLRAIDALLATVESLDAEVVP